MSRSRVNNESTGFLWKKTKNEKRRQQSQTTGKQKGVHCQATPIERYMAKRNRSWKHQEYETWSESHTGKK